MKKKKRGSTLVVVVVTMTIIFITGTAILSLTASNYKMRINESKRLQNLYEADSGLDVVENIIIKTAQEAIKYADKKVKEEFTKSDINNSDEINSLFKDKFYEFLSLNKKDNLDIMQYLILNKKVITTVNDDGSVDLESYREVSEDKDYIIEIPEDGYLVNTNGGEIENITIDIKSTFETKDEELKNKRTVSSRFTIVAPEYNADISVIDIYPVFDGKAITADGDMKAEGNAELSISGDIWIKGQDSSLNYDNPSFTFDKYNGGIELNNIKFNIDGNIYTANTFHLNNGVKENSEVNGDIYAKNIYIGKDLNSTISSNNKITFKKDVIVNNDLAMNTTNSSIIIENNFYGINDKTTDPSTANTALNSSSIIVNESAGSELIVNKDSYILGVAYLNATDFQGNKYQTGESVAVKGNYLAYTDVEDVLDGENNVTLKYYTPLQLLESINGSSDTNTKADYFIEYYSNSNKKYNYSDGGVKLQGKVISAGASVKDSTGKIQKTSVSDEDMIVINNERDEFARNVFAMGDTTGFSGDLYGDQKMIRTVSNQIDFSKIKDIHEDLDNSKGNLILIGDGQSITIENNKINGEEIEEALIITNGDITIKGNLNFTGTIITSGNINFEGSGNKAINYDPQVIREIIAANYDEIKDIFLSSSKGREVKISSSAEMYNSVNFLEKSLWKIEK
jgi:hypothetical protein